MANEPRSSFIPKQASGVVPTRVRKKRRFHVFGFLSTVLLLASLVFAGGAYFYKDYSQSRLEGEKQALAQARGSFNEGDMASIREFDRRIAAAGYLLDNHLVPSRVFDALELNTKQNIQFTNFEFSQDPSRDVTLSLNGGTEKFNTVALQALQFGKDALFAGAVFTDISTRGADLEALEEGTSPEEEEEEHSIGFTVTAPVSSSLLLYQGNPVNAGAILEQEEATDVQEESTEEGTTDATDSTEDEEAAGSDTEEAATSGGAETPETEDAEVTTN